MWRRGRIFFSEAAQNQYQAILNDYPGKEDYIKEEFSKLLRAVLQLTASKDWQQENVDDLPVVLDVINKQEYEDLDGRPRMRYLCSCSSKAYYKFPIPGSEKARGASQRRDKVIHMDEKLYPYHVDEDQQEKHLINFHCKFYLIPIGEDGHSIVLLEYDLGRY